HRHPLVDIIGEQFQPRVKLPAVQQAGFSVEKLLYLMQRLQTHVFPPNANSKPIAQSTDGDVFYKPSQFLAAISFAQRS
ncbi:MAG: hypothetical protein ACK58U_01335, partial [Rubrivivax sp.]